jgi:hypothetical protein
VRLAAERPVLRAAFRFAIVRSFRPVHAGTGGR